MSRIGESIKKLRMENGMSQETLAECLNVSRQAVSNWETGKTQPDAQTLIQISAVFQVMVDEIIQNRIVKKEKHRRYNWLVPLLSMLLSVVHFTLALKGFLNPVGVMISVMLASAISLIMYTAFENSIKNRDFTMLAGHKKAYEADLSRYERQLRATSQLVSGLSFLLNVLYFLLYICATDKRLLLSMSFLGVFIIGLVMILSAVNFKYRRGD
ncbi:helix-turn-helix transcriptional regulator [Suipraeoptans intestinalis]|uniref:helix-turn-helix transcriptional regulator n=1 Tax=Suipraeoptans intestinalis TaxID=2606628 RepID=UPI002A752CC4|nr:helix-turn-helix transcriptional regulator [Suipraeoptans intestinalis]MDY3121376.1 helix-turn-helix transcriptional regulator [Suipraeoptans intestinalis]